MSQAEQVQLRYAYVMAMTTNAQGDYARTADGTANSMRTFQGAVDNLNIALGEHLLPLLTPLIQGATNLINKFAEADPKLQQLILTIGMIAIVVGPALVATGSLISSVGTIIGVFGKSVHGYIECRRYYGDAYQPGWNRDNRNHGIDRNWLFADYKLGHN